MQLVTFKIKDYVKAVVITKGGDPSVLAVHERPIPVVGAYDVLIRVKAAGVNRPDVLQRKGVYPPPAGASPDIPGLEVAGIIETCGSLVSRWKVGDHVCALITGGGYAEYAKAHEGHCLPLPNGWTFIESASLPETVFTVWHNAFQRGALKPGEHFLVHGGTSGIGITAIQLAKAFGATVYTTAGSDEKCNACSVLGADHCVNYRKEDFSVVWKNEGMDVILDMIGGDYIPRNISLLRPEGRLVFINSMQGNKYELDVMKIMQKRLTITGSTLRSRDDEFKTSLAKSVYESVWPIIEKGEFKPVIYQKIALVDAIKAHEVMESSKHIGKIVLEVA